MPEKDLLAACKSAYEIIHIEADDNDLSPTGSVFKELTQKLRAVILAHDPEYISQFDANWAEYKAVTGDYNEESGHA